MQILFKLKKVFVFELLFLNYLLIDTVFITQTFTIHIYSLLFYVITDSLCHFFQRDIPLDIIFHCGIIRVTQYLEV